MSEITSIGIIHEKKRKSKPRKGYDLSEIQAFISQLSTENKPTLHVNGPSYLNCVLTVDLGEALNPTKLSDEDEETLKEKMKTASKNVLGRDLPIRVSKDSTYNVWWASVG